MSGDDGSGKGEGEGNSRNEEKRKVGRRKEIGKVRIIQNKREYTQEYYRPTSSVYQQYYVHFYYNE